MTKIIERILDKIGDRELLDKISILSKSDLNSLLLEIHHEQAQEATAPEVLKAYQANRFTVPSELDPVDYHLLEAELLSLAKKSDIRAILLSPSAPFASCSVFGCVDQNNIVSATRGVEILSDPTNMLSIIIAEQLKRNETDNTSAIHYGATARVLRAQPFPKIKGYYAHFGIFCIVSSGKDTGSYSCEKELLSKQLSFYKNLASEKFKGNLSIVLRKRRGYTDGDGFFEAMAELVKTALPDVPLSYDLDHEDNNYYKGINYKMYVEKDDEKTEIGDGGFVDWIAKLVNNKKERCLISGIGIDRLLL
ncbi:MAG: hypothetical protein FWG88_04180 [Oscillospiraceae bacterium]|nr:hypothetical protein [Oscillospiraceae bacterium]